MRRVLDVDFAGDTVLEFNTRNGIGNYASAEARWSEEPPTKIAAHVTGSSGD